MNRLFFSFFKFIERGLIAFYDGENRDGCLSRLKLFIFNQVYFLNHFYHMLLRNGKYTFIPYFLHTPLFELSTVFYACQSPHSLHTCFSLLSSLKEDSVQVWIVVPIFILIVSCYFVVAPIIEAPSMEVITHM